MKTLLVAINAKYIHSNPALYSLKAYAEDYLSKKANGQVVICREKQKMELLQMEQDTIPVEIELAECTINQLPGDILKEIYLRRPDFIGISCYIWNIEMVRELVGSLRMILPAVPIWLGGPEVSYLEDEELRGFAGVTGIMRGEGEETFTRLILHYATGTPMLRDIVGITYYTDAEEQSRENQNSSQTESYGGFAEKNLITERNLHTENAFAEEDAIIVKNAVTEMNLPRISSNPPAPSLDMNELPFPYKDVKNFENRIVYYETSRGCPFNCAYCLSSVDKRLRYRSMEKVERELQFFLDANVPQVKFIDRTFNCNHQHSMAILRYIKEHDNGITNFHFEIAGDILTEEEMETLASLREGLVQLEIGVQSTNLQTLSLVNRRTDLDKLKVNTERLLKNRNIHLHLDLIAGLPKENLVSFIHSFNDVYRMGSDELQLGFLKLLKGSPMEQLAKQYGIVTGAKPPYELLYTDDLSYEDVIFLKEVEEMLELYHNSQQFAFAEQVLLKALAQPFDLYQGLAAYYKKKAEPTMNSNRTRRYELMLEYGAELFKNDEKLNDPDQDKISLLREMLTIDFYQRENAKARPAFAEDLSEYKDEIYSFYKKEAKEKLYFTDYGDVDFKQLMRMTHIEVIRSAKAWDMLQEMIGTDRNSEDGIQTVSGTDWNSEDGIHAVLFDYHKKSPVTKAVRLVPILL